MKGETYKDKSGKSWLVWYDKNGESENDTWTTTDANNIPTHKYKASGGDLNDDVIYLEFEIRLFPNGKYGFGYNCNFLEIGYDKIKSDFFRRYDTETSCLQHAFEHVIKQRKRTDKKFKKSILNSFLESLEQKINPKTLF